MTLQGQALGQAIDAAFAGELFAQRKALLPTVGKEDRALLFTAIGSGVLQYLAEQPAGDVTVDTAAGVTPFAVDFHVATLTYAGGSVTGSGFASETVTVTVLGGDIDVESASGPTFTQTVSGPAGAVVDARDTKGDAAQTVIP